MNTKLICSNILFSALMLIAPTVVSADQYRPKLTESTIALYNDPYWSRQWNLHQNYFNYITPRIPMERPLKIAIIDTPIDRSNPEFDGIEFIDGCAGPGQVLGRPIDSSYADMTTGIYQRKSCRMADGSLDPHCNHGTAVASILFSKPNNSLGSVGILTNVSVIENAIHTTKGIKVGKNENVCYSIRHAIDTSIDLGAKVISISLFSGGDINGLDEVMEKAEKSGVVVVALAGNAGEAGVPYPGKHPKVISVANVRSDGSLASSSSRGPEVDIAAPGSFLPVYTQKVDYPYESFSGTSAAAPMVAGTVALMMKQNPGITPEEVRQRLYSTALKKPKGGRDNGYGHGILNMPGALGINIPESVRNPKPGDAKPVPPAPVPPPKEEPPIYTPIVDSPRDRLRRLAGSDRIGTAIEVSKSVTTDHNVPTVVLARADDYPDSITAGTLARAYGTHVLITNKDFLHPLVKERIVQMQGGNHNATVMIVGGYSAISASVENEIRALGRKVVRIGGADRIDTSLQIADHIKSRSGYSQVVYSDGWNYKTSMIAGSYASRVGAVQVLVNNTAIDERTINNIKQNHGKDRVYIGMSSEGYNYTKIGLRTYLYGDIGDLSVQLNANTGCHDRPAGIATANSYADALTGGAHISAKGGCLYLIDSSSVNTHSVDAVSSYLQTGPISGRNDVYIYGGQAAIPEGIVNHIVPR